MPGNLQMVSKPNANHMGDLGRTQVQTQWVGVGWDPSAFMCSQVMRLLLLGGLRAQVPGNSWLIVGAQKHPVELDKYLVNMGITGAMGPCQ